MTERFPFGPSTRPEPPLFPREQRVSPDRPAAVQGAKRRSEPLTARTDPGSFGEREREQATPAGGLLRGFPQRSMRTRASTLLVELRPILHIHPHPQTSKRLHLRFYLGRADHPERVK